MGENLGLPNSLLAPSGGAVNVIMPVEGQRYSCGSFETKFKSMERGVEAASGNALEAAPELGEAKLIRDIVWDSEASCDGLSTPELIKYPNRCTPLEPDWHYSLLGDEHMEEWAGMTESIDITQFPQNSSRQSMVAYTKADAWELNPHRLQCLEMAQTEGSSPIAMERRYTCINKEVLKDDMLPLLNSDSDWDLVESDDEDECIFPYSPCGSVIDWESKTTSTPQCVGIDIFDDSNTVAQHIPIHSGQTKPSTEPPQNLTSVVPSPSSQ
ncbi:hypothetical protein V501_02378 [Pseudogymnoascus sp. VKM F-4519 (FW-2642)]|nr:hypothetical protein V501_02378 [Pseudogymnoascus sp. VKM F-4519 (FW-2642)]